MAIYKEDIVDIELESGTIHRSFLCHAIGLGDNQGNRFGVRLFRNGAAENVGSASVTGLFMAPNGTNYIINGSGNVWKSGNVAGVILPSGCYAVEGQFTLAIKLSLSGVVTTMRIIDGVVSNTGTTGAVVPSSNVPTSDQIIAAYQQAVAVIDSSVRYDVDQSLTAAQKTKARTNIEAAGLAQVVRVDADQSLTSTQKGKARTNIEAAGLAQVVRVDADQSLTSTQKGKARTNIEAAGLAQVVRVDADQELTNTQKGKARTNIAAASQADLEAEATARAAADTDLKSALQNSIRINGETALSFTLDSGKAIRYGDGTYGNSSSDSITNYIDVSGYRYIKYKSNTSSSSTGTSGMAFYDADKVYISGVKYVQQSTTKYITKIIEVPEGAHYARFTAYTDTVTYGTFEAIGITNIVENGLSSGSITLLPNEFGSIYDYFVVNQVAISRLKNRFIISGTRSGSSGNVIISGNSHYSGAISSADDSAFTLDNFINGHTYIMRIRALDSSNFTNTNPYIRLFRKSDKTNYDGIQMATLIDKKEHSIVFESDGSALAIVIYFVAVTFRFDLIIEFEDITNMSIDGYLTEANESWEV